VLSRAEPVAFVPSTDLGRSRSFYEGVLGLPVVQADDFAVVLRCGVGGTIRITNVGRALHVQPFTVLGWDVEDLHDEIAALTVKGVEFLRVPSIEQDDAGVWTTGDGSQVAWFQDPDGNTLSLAHH
jgi:catechol 2,3-dioxygenase-like lactoylglutathione lyase family enzyme